MLPQNCSSCAMVSPIANDCVLSSLRTDSQECNLSGVRAYLSPLPGWLALSDSESLLPTTYRVKIDTLCFKLQHCQYQQQNACTSWLHQLSTATRKLCFCTRCVSVLIIQMVLLACTPCIQTHLEFLCLQCPMTVFQAHVAGN